MKLLRQTLLLLRKDLLLELRRHESLMTMFFFGALLLFVFNFSFELTPARVSELAPGLLWLAFLFTGTLGLTQLFEGERGNHCLDALLMSPIDRGALFLAKTCFNIVLMGLVELVVMPLFWILQPAFMAAAAGAFPNRLSRQRGILRAGDNPRRGNPKGPGPRALAAAGAFSVDGSGNSRDHSLHGSAASLRRIGRRAALVASSHRI